MFILRQTSVKMAVLLHKQAKVPFILIIAVLIIYMYSENAYSVCQGSYYKIHVILRCRELDFFKNIEK